MPDREHLGFASGGIVAVSILLFAGGWIVSVTSNEAKPFTHMVAVLFAIPLITQVFCSFIIRKRQRADGQDEKNVFLVFYLYTMFVCLFVYCVLWIVYATPLQSKQIFSCLALVFILLLVWLAWIMFRATFEVLPNGPGSPVDRSNLNIWKPWTSTWRKCLKADVSKEQPFALLFFFMVFLSIAYLFAFAFAFHDKSRPDGAALFMRDLAAAKSPITTTERPKSSQRFRFGEGSAVLEHEEIKQPGIARQDFKALAVLRKDNFEGLTRIADSIQLATEEGNRVHVILVGHADETPTKGAAYQSNYELAEARARNVQGAIMAKLFAIGKGNWMNIEWLCQSASNEPDPQPLQDIIDLNPRRNQKGARRTSDSKSVEMRFVDVIVEPENPDPTTLMMQQMRLDKQSAGYKPLSLMDYVYFSIYTITTTGYGDILPNTPYTKFLISIANILEVFFLVVFFNALLSVRMENSYNQEEAEKVKQESYTQQAASKPSNGSEKQLRGRGLLD